jgi:AmmeMemoRadiSam system protein B
MPKIRPPAVAGKFYPHNQQQLREMVEGYLADAGVASTGPRPKAIIAPHAGYIYSGPIAGTAYSYLARANSRVRRVVLLGPAHWVPFRGLAASSAEAFATPLGNVPLDQSARQAILTLPQVCLFDEAHEPEHSLEVHLPFLQVALADFSLVPLVVGAADAAEIAEVLQLLWGGPETVVVISSDLSHYHDYSTARALDQATSRAIEQKKALKESQACGGRAINGLLQMARQYGLRPEIADLRSSGDTAGPRDRVVGYGAYLFWEQPA